MRYLPRCLLVLAVCLASCSSPQRLAELDPTALPELRGYIQPSKLGYQVGEKIVVEYWLANTTDKDVREEVADGSQEVGKPFQGYHFNATERQKKERHLVLQEAGMPFQGTLQIANGAKKLFVTNTFLAEEAGAYLLSFDLRWRDKKRIAFKPVTIGVQAVQAEQPKRDPALEKTLLGLASADNHTRLQARDVIRKMGIEAAPLLIEMLAMDNVQLRMEAMLLLIALRQEAVPILLKHATHPDREARMRIIYALGEIGEVKALPALSNALLKDADTQIRFTALRAITKNFDDRIAIPLMIMALKDSERDIRAAAMEVLKTRTPAELKLSFPVDAPAEEREKAWKEWQEWWQQQDKEG